jgi:hypothetical protein
VAYFGVIYLTGVEPVEKVLFSQLAKGYIEKVNVREAV